jgi:multiple sugar transport system ATP-binding protein
MATEDRVDQVQHAQATGQTVGSSMMSGPSSGSSGASGSHRSGAA